MQLIASLAGFQKSLSPQRFSQGGEFFAVNQVPWTTVLCRKTQILVVLRKTDLKIGRGARVVTAGGLAAKYKYEWHIE